MSKQSVVLTLCLMLLAVRLTAQDYIVQGSTPNLFLTHKVAAKETWYSLGRSYGLQPKEIAAYNKLAIATPLEIEQVIRIPLTTANFSQSEAKAQKDFLVPVYHVVGEKEWMYRISVNHNKVPVEQLEKWNSINRDQAKTGMKLIVGFLKLKDGANTASAATPSSGEAGAKAPAATPTSASANTPATTAKQEASGTAAQPAAQTQPKATMPKNGGYFKNDYQETGKSFSGVAGIFKSTSGWSDGKYYALMNNVVVGTIIKVVYQQTNKTIYAKVLGEMPDMKESAGLALRISDAAANELGAATNKFSVDVKY